MTDNETNSFLTPDNALDSKVEIAGKNGTNVSIDRQRDTSSVPHPKDTNYRYLILVFVCFISFGCYFCYDTPGALQEQFLHDLEITTSEFSIFYSLYSWPNIVLCFVGGYLLDAVFGLRLGTNLFCIITLIGQIIFALACFYKIYWLMQVGRFIFGIGGETLTVAQSSWAGHWFKDKELNMVFGLQLSCARLGATVNFLSMVPAYKSVTSYFKGHEALGITLLIAALSCIVSQISSLILAYFDWKADKKIPAISNSDVTNQTKQRKSLHILDVKYFPLSYWIIVLVCVTYYVTVFPFIGLGTVFFQRKYKLARNKAAQCDGLIYLISLFGSPLFGLLVDRVRNNQYFILTGVLCTLISHLMLGLSFLNPWVAMVFMGLAFSLIACGLWPMVSYEVPERLLATAYGMMISCMNIGLAISSVIAGKIVERHGYFILEVYFLSFICLSVTLTMVLILLKNKSNNRPVVQITEKTEDVTSELMQMKTAENS